MIPLSLKTLKLDVNAVWFAYFTPVFQTFHREYLTLPTPKSQDKNLSESGRPQQTVKMSLRPLDGQSSSKTTLMVSLYQTLQRVNITHNHIYYLLSCK